MNRRDMRWFVIGLLVVAVSLSASTLPADPVVGNVRASQRTDGSGLVDIYYDLSGATFPVTVDVIISKDNGATYDIRPSLGRVWGNIGPGISNGADRHVTWSAGYDRPDVYWPNARVKVTALEGQQTVTYLLPGGIPLEMVRIPAGSFQMGAFDPGWNRDWEIPVHTVNINYDFYMGKYEVTQEQWLAIMGSNPASTSYGYGSNFAVYHVSWNDIRTTNTGFLDKLNDALSLPRGTLRLPSEAEWEYACRAGTTTRFSFGDSTCSADSCTDCDLSNYAWWCGNNSGSTGSPTYGTKRVGQKLPNPFGLFDIHGNVWEWCEDWWHDNYINAPTDGSAWVAGGETTRVIRGGAWQENSSPHVGCRSASRTARSPDTTTNYHNIGFRLSRTH